MPNAECRMPNAKCRMPNAKCQMPNAQCQMPNAECRMPNAECQMPNAKCQMPNAKCRMPNAKCQMPNAKCQMPNAKCRMPNAECRMPNAELGTEVRRGIGTENPSAQCAHWAPPLQGRQGRGGGMGGRECRGAPCVLPHSGGHKVRPYKEDGGRGEFGIRHSECGTLLNYG